MHEPISYAYLETTNYCILKCSVCIRDEVVKKIKAYEFDRLELVLEKLKDQPIKAKLMGLGEPFLHLNFLQSVKCLRIIFQMLF